MREMHRAERNTSSDLELSIPCRELPHCGAATTFSLHVFPITHCPIPSMSAVFLRSPGRFLFCVRVLPQETVSRLCRIFCAEMGWEIGVHLWADVPETNTGDLVLSSHWHPSTQSELIHFALLRHDPVLRQNTFFHCDDQSSPVYSSMILMQDCGQDPKDLFLHRYLPQPEFLSPS